MTTIAYASSSIAGSKKNRRATASTNLAGRAPSHPRTYRWAAKASVAGIAEFQTEALS